MTFIACRGSIPKRMAERTIIQCKTLAGSWFAKLLSKNSQWGAAQDRWLGALTLRARRVYSFARQERDEIGHRL
jgi:hypothetical protein